MPYPRFQRDPRHPRHPRHPRENFSATIYPRAPFDRISLKHVASFGRKDFIRP